MSSNIEMTSEDGTTKLVAIPKKDWAKIKRDNESLTKRLKARDKMVIALTRDLEKLKNDRCLIVTLEKKISSLERSQGLLEEDNSQLRLALDSKGLMLDTPLPSYLLKQIDQGDITPLEAILSHQGIVKQTLVRKAGIARSTLYRAFAEPNKSLVSVYLKLAKALGCTMDFLITGRAVITVESSKSKKAP